MKLIKFNNILFTLSFIAISCFVISACNNNDIVLPSNAKETVEITETAFISASPSATSTASPTATPEPYTTIVLGSTGDIMCHLMQLMNAQNFAEGDYEYTRTGAESYSFDHWFEYIKPSLEYADLMIGNLETTIATDNSLVTGYPFFATPKELLPSLKTAGFDVLVSGNNHILDKEQAGLISTVTALENSEIYHTGAWTSLESKNTPLVIDVKGIKVGIISATCSLNDQDRHLTEEEKSYMYLMTNNLEEVSQQIANSKNAGAEVIIVCPHWSYENRIVPDAIISSLAKEYIKMGADIIFAHHPHVLQPVDKITVSLDDSTTREGIVFWSLGNFISNQMGDPEMLTSVIAFVNITKDNLSGEIIIDSSSYLPIWTFIEYNRDTNSKSYCVLPVGQSIDYPETIDRFDITTKKNALNEAWLLATNRLGSDVAQPLRSVPE